MSYTLWAAKVGIIPPFKKPAPSLVDHRLWPINLLESVDIDALDSLIWEENVSYLDEAFLWRFSYQGENYWGAIYVGNEPLLETDLVYLRGLASAYHQWRASLVQEEMTRIRSRLFPVRATEYVPF